MSRETDAPDVHPGEVQTDLSLVRDKLERLSSQLEDDEMLNERNLADAAAELCTQAIAACQAIDCDPRGFACVAFLAADARALYDHTGTMPHEPDTWTGRVRRELSSALHASRRKA